MTGESIRDQLWRAVDPTGDQRALIEAADAAPAWLLRLGRSLNASWTRPADTGSEYAAHMDSVEAAVRLLVPRGWAVMSMDTAAVAGAVAAVRAGRTEEADHLLAGQWEGEGEWRVWRVGKRVRSMAAADAGLSALFRERARLLDLAAGHHLAGRYDASVPLLQAQMEGIVIDVTGGKKFFTKRPGHKADLVDPKDLVSIEACLAALQVTYGGDVTETQREGSLSRHAVLHGRELAYDTQVNSAKTWSVLDAVVHWALPQSRALADARRAERQAANAGSQAIDGRGRRVDDREVAETWDALRVLQGPRWAGTDSGAASATTSWTASTGPPTSRSGGCPPSTASRPTCGRTGRRSRPGEPPSRAGSLASPSPGTASTSSSTCTRARGRLRRSQASPGRRGATRSTRRPTGPESPPAALRQTAACRAPLSAVRSRSRFGWRRTWTRASPGAATVLR